MNKIHFASLAFMCSLVSFAPPDEKTIQWQGKKYSAGALPEKMDRRARNAIAAWQPWAAENDYRMDVDADGRIIVLTSKERDRVDKLLKVVEKTRSWFEALLPVPPRIKQEKPVTKAAATRPAKTDDVVPEDPEAPAPATKPVSAGAGKATEEPKSWGTGSLEPDSQSVVMLVLTNNRDYTSALEHVKVLEPKLAAWASTAGRQLGFVLESPLCGAYLENAGGQDDPEWSPDHEMVNRIAQLLTLSRFGRLPYWLTQGIAWEAEMNFDGGVYCFPYRQDDFVSVGEHESWPLDLKNMFKDRKAEPLSMTEFAVWKRGRYEATPALISWGLTRYLRLHHGPALAPMLEEFRVHWDEENRKTNPDGTWVRMPDFELPIPSQRATLEKHTSADVLEKAAAWFAKQDEPKPKSGAGSKAEASAPKR